MLNVQKVTGAAWFNAFDSWGEAIARDDDQDAANQHNKLLDMTCQLASTRSHSDADLLAKLEVWVQDNIDTCDELYEHQLSTVLILSVIRDLMAREKVRVLRPHTLKILEAINHRIRAETVVASDEDIEARWAGEQQKQAAT